MSRDYYTIYGAARSYFTRKVTGYFNYKEIPHRFTRSNMMRTGQLRGEGWRRGIPVVRTPDGTFMWDSTPMIHYLDGVFPERGVFHPDPVQQFLAYLIEDASDEWYTHSAIAVRWFYERDAELLQRELGMDMSMYSEVTPEQAGGMARQMMTERCHKLGVTEATAPAWVDALDAWMRVLDGLLADRAYFFGARPSIADFAVYGASVAHFYFDPTSRALMDDHALRLRAWTDRLREPHEQEFGEWCAVDDVPDAMIAVLTEIGREYLPWAAAAGFERCKVPVDLRGVRIDLETIPYTGIARRELLARYQAAKCDRLDEILERAGILQHFDGHDTPLDAPPTYDAPPRGERN